MTKQNPTQKKSTSKRTIWSVGILVFVSVLGITIYSSKTNQSNAPVITTPATTSEQAAPNDINTIESTEWKVVAPSNGGYTVKIPDGWNISVNNNREVNIMSIADMVFVAGTPVKQTITNLSVINQRILFGTWVVKAGEPGVENSLNNENPIKFSLNDGTVGMRYSHIQTEKQEFYEREIGYQQYEYIFAKNNNTIKAAYNVLPGETNQLELIEKVVKTLTIL